MDQGAFLKSLDSTVWVSKRLYPERLVVLDDLDGSEDAAGTLVFELLQCLGPPQYGSLLAVADAGMRQGVLLASGGAASSLVQQFTLDLWIYGLREAMALVHEYPGFEVSPELRERMLVGYRTVGEFFLQRQDTVRSKLEGIVASLRIGSSVPLSGLQRIVGVRMADGIWDDGNSQLNHAT